MNTITEIAQQLWAPAKRLHQEGIPYHAYLTELTWLLFFKLVSVVTEVNPIPSHLSWDIFILKTGQSQLRFYHNLLITLGQVNDPYISGIYAQADSCFTQPEQLAQTLQALAAIETIPLDDLGEVYEILLEKCAYEDNNSLHIAPRSLVDLLVILTQPKAGEFIQDPLAGPGRFLVSADQYIKVVSQELSGYSQKTLNSPHILASEPNLVRQRLGLMNCFLHQMDFKENILLQWQDNLLSNQQDWPQPDIIFSLLAFANESHNELRQHDASLALLQHIYQTLKPGGRAAVILPDNVLKAAGPAKQVRRTLLDTCVVHTILRLPHHIFYPSKIEAQVLFFWRGFSEHDKTEHIWFYDLRTHFPSLGPYWSLTREHLIPFETVYGDDPLGQAPRQEQIKDKRWRCFNRKTIAQQGELLDLCWLQEDEEALNLPINYDNIWEVLGQTVEELESLTELLRD